VNDIQPHAPAELEDHLGYWLRRVSNHVSGAFARALQDRQVSVTEWVALRHIYDRPGIKSGELASSLGMTRGAISKIVDKLEEKGWITCSAKPEDSRVQMISLTSDGARVVPELAEVADTNDETFFGCLTTVEQSVLKRILLKLTNAHKVKDIPID